MSSLEVHNSTDKSSASTSPCPSPVVQMVRFQSQKTLSNRIFPFFKQFPIILSHPDKKPQRLLPTNLYVVLYNFRSRHEDEISLK